MNGLDGPKVAILDVQDTRAALEWKWLLPGRGSIGAGTSVALKGSLNEAELGQKIELSRPAGFPDADVGVLMVCGMGTWLDAEGREHHEADLVELTVYPDERHLAAEVAVRHAFGGRRGRTRRVPVPRTATVVRER
ncbi:hypothetical protein [Streptomyces sp. NPDC001635]|nr:hypothetical protein E4K10_26940 [Streptomyces sp. T1317-0309]